MDVPPGTKAGTRARSPKPPFYETALSSPSETKLALSKTGCFLSEAEILRMGVFPPLLILDMQSQSSR